MVSSAGKFPLTAHRICLPYGSGVAKITSLGEIGYDQWKEGGKRCGTRMSWARKGWSLQSNYGVTSYFIVFSYFHIFQIHLYIELRC